MKKDEVKAGYYIPLKYDLADYTDAKLITFLNEGILAANEDLESVHLASDFDSSYKEFHFFFKTQTPTCLDEIEELLIAQGVNVNREDDSDEEEDDREEEDMRNAVGAVLLLRDPNESLDDPHLLEASYD